MDVAWIGRFEDEDYTLEAVQGDAASFGAWEGQTTPLAGTYCTRLMRGELPNAVPDARRDPRTASLPPTRERGIGAYVGVPLVLSDGHVYGALCCLSHDPDPTLGARDVKFVELLAGMIVEELDRRLADDERRAEQAARIWAALEGDVLRTVYQPIVSLPSLEVTCAEALTRFSGGPASPATWFAEAAELGLGVELELAAIVSALEGLEHLPAAVRLSVNASPAAAASPRLLELLSATDAERVQLEVTEQSRVASYDALLPALARLRGLGVRLAVDDAGAGYAGLSHILQVSPDVIKLDVVLVRDIDADPAREALARSLVLFAGDVGSRIVAEGVETQAQLDTLNMLDVDAVQGYLLGRPGPLPLAIPPRRPSLQATPAR
jgi:EAL domain-containing protein (putative c-di-GMP-specific phosphodiesterase class I)